jgi:hypothetical protein
MAVLRQNNSPPGVANSTLKHGIALLIGCIVTIERFTMADKFRVKFTTKHSVKHTEFNNSVYADIVILALKEWLCDPESRSITIERVKDD